MLIYRITQALDDNHLPYAIVGGFAVALHGAVRGTLDVDIVIRLIEADFTKAEKTLHGLGLESRIPVNGKQLFQFRDEFMKNKNLVAWSFYNPKNPSEILDIIITKDLRNFKIVEIQSGKHKLKVASIQDLIAMKQEAGRPQDKEDIKALKTLMRGEK